MATDSRLCLEGHQRFWNITGGASATNAMAAQGRQWIWMLGVYMQRRMKEQGLSAPTQELLDEAFIKWNKYAPAHPVVQHVYMRNLCTAWEYGQQLAPLKDHVDRLWLNSPVDKGIGCIMHPADCALWRSMTRDHFYFFCEKTDFPENPSNQERYKQVALILANAFPTPELIDQFNIRTKEITQYVLSSKPIVFEKVGEYSLLDKTRTYFLNEMPPMKRYNYLSLFTKRGNFDNTLDLICQYTKQLLSTPVVQQMIRADEASAEAYITNNAEKRLTDYRSTVQSRVNATCGVE